MLQRREGLRVYALKKWKSGGKGMGIRGKKPTPRRLLELGGRVHKKKEKTLDIGEMTREDVDEKIFKDLPSGVLDRAKKTLKLLSEQGVLNPCDAEPFARYVQHLRIAYEANEIVAQEGIISIDKNGIPHKHPALQIHRDNSLAALRYEEQFGLTPSARMRLRGIEEVKADREVAVFDEFVKDAEE